MIDLIVYWLWWSDQKWPEQDKEKQSHIRNIVVKLWNTKLKEKKQENKNLEDSWDHFL